MNREIKFRGKRVDNGEWIYGCLINNLFYKNDTKKPCCYIIPDQLPEGQEYYYDCFEDVANWIEEFEVVHETVGQYTGLKDKNVKEIYEGDLFQVASNKIYQVKYTEDGESNFEWYGGVFVLWLNYETFFPFDEYAMKNGKVTGNIHENKDLLTY